MPIIKQIIKAPTKHWVGNGFNVHGYFDEFTEATSPFLMLDFASKKYFGPSTLQRGVGDHPHRGFETVTFAYHGGVQHRDSAGNVDVINAGDVQWMTAGSGIIHQEFFEEGFNSQGGDFEMIQLWINLPAKHKMSPPKYQALKNSQIPKIVIDNVDISVVAGSFNTGIKAALDATKGVAKTFSDLNVYQLHSAHGQTSLVEFQIPTTHKAMMLVLNGQVEVAGSQIDQKSLVIFGANSDKISIKSNSQYQILFLSGEPLNQPIAHYGPFVMNTQDELIQAFADYHSGKFEAVKLERPKP